MDPQSRQVKLAVICLNLSGVNVLTRRMGKTDCNSSDRTIDGVEDDRFLLVPSAMRSYLVLLTSPDA